MNWNRCQRVTLAESGDVQVTVEEAWTRFVASWWWGRERDRTNAQRTRALDERLRFIDRRSVRESESRTPYTRGHGSETFGYQIPGLAAQVGDELIVPLGFLEGEGSFSELERKTELAFLWPWVEVDEVTLVPPAGYTVAELPPVAELRNPFLEVNFKAVAQSDGSVRVSRRLTQRAGRAPVADYPAIRGVFRAADDLRRAVVVFKRRGP